MKYNITKAPSYLQRLQSNFNWLIHFGCQHIHVGEVRKLANLNQGTEHALKLHKANVDFLKLSLEYDHLMAKQLYMGQHMDKYSIARRTKLNAKVKEVYSELVCANAELLRAIDTYYLP